MYSSRWVIIKLNLKIKKQVNLDIMFSIVKIKGMPNISFILKLNFIIKKIIFYKKKKTFILDLITSVGKYY